jgi:uncharacterized protein (DUF4415 family)
MNKRVITTITSFDEIPEFVDESEMAAFWDTHGMSEALLEEAIIPVANEPEWLPPVRPRTMPVAIRFDRDVVQRLKAIAKKKHKGYQTLLKEFVSERLYEEEKREGIIPS